jgi:hypothetical protein
MAVAEAWLAMQALCGVQACYKAHHPHAAARQTPNDNHAPARTHSLTHVGITLAGVFQQAGGPNAVLGLTKDPTVKQIRQAFQTLALQRHPARKKSELSDEE